MKPSFAIFNVVLLRRPARVLELDVEHARHVFVVVELMSCQSHRVHKYGT